MIPHHRNSIARKSGKSSYRRASCKLIKVHTQETDSIEPWKGLKDEEDYIFNTENHTKAIIELTDRSKQPSPTRLHQKLERQQLSKEIQNEGRNNAVSKHRRHQSENNIKFKHRRSQHDKMKYTNGTSSPVQFNMNIQRISISSKQTIPQPSNYFKLTFPPKRYSKKIVRKSINPKQQFTVLELQRKSNPVLHRFDEKVLKLLNSKSSLVDHPKLALEKIRKSFLELKIDKLTPKAALLRNSYFRLRLK